MPLRLLEVFLDCVDELVVLSGLRHLRQGLHQLLFRVVHITQLLDEQFVERADCGHRSPPSPREITRSGGDGSKALARSTRRVFFELQTHTTKAGAHAGSQRNALRIVAQPDSDVRWLTTLDTLAHDGHHAQRLALDTTHA